MTAAKLFLLSDLWPPGVCAQVGRVFSSKGGGPIPTGGKWCKSKCMKGEMFSKLYQQKTSDDLHFEDLFYIYYMYSSGKEGEEFLFI